MSIHVTAIDVSAPTAERTSRTVPAAVLIVLLTGTFMAAFDFFVVNVAAPSVQHDLHASQAELELVVGGYAFAYAGALVLGGRLGDLFGHRRLFAIGMIGFATTSALCGVAAGPQQLIAARLAQGVTAALMLPQVLALISAGSDGAGRARAMAWYGVAAGAGSIAGQVFGGLLVTADVAGLGWRLIFLVNVPIGAVGAIAALRVLPHRPHRVPEPISRRATLDPLGALGLAAGLALLLVPLTVGRAAGWPWWTWASMLAAVPVLTATVMWQRVLHERGGQPLLDPSLLRARSFRTGLVANFAFMSYFASYMFTLALLLQAGLGLSALGAGLAFAPAGVTFSASALLAPRLAARHGVAVLVGGSLLTAVGLVGLAAVAATGGRHASIAAIVTIAAVISLGNGLVLPSLVGAALLDVPARHAGTAAGALTTAQQFASAAGVAAIGTVFFAAARSGAGVGMAWSTAADAALMLAVAAAVIQGGRPARERRQRVQEDFGAKIAPKSDEELEVRMSAMTAPIHEQYPSTAAGQAVRLALDEDGAGDDVTTNWAVGDDVWVAGHLVAREAGVIAGLPVAAEVYRQLDPRVRVRPRVSDGDRIDVDEQVFTIEGPARAVITGERVALNFLQRLCGIATSARAHVDAVAGLASTILDTRKTVPGLRSLDKYAVTCGGATNHRRDLSAMVLVKENHLAAAGGVAAAVDAVRAGAERVGRPSIGIEVEVTDMAQAREAMQCAVDWVLLDNMPRGQMKSIVDLRNRTPDFHAIRLEASGNVTLASVREIARTGIDAISIGALTHSPAALDLSMLVWPVRRARWARPNVRE